MKSTYRLRVIGMLTVCAALLIASRVATSQEYKKWEPKDASPRYTEFYAAIKELCDKAERSQAASPDFLRDMKRVLEAYAPTNEVQPPPEEKATRAMKKVNASNSEFVTVMKVQRGQKLRIEAAGKWIAAPSYGECDADGKSYTKNVITGQKSVIGYLEGCISGGVPFKIGKTLDEYEVPTDGDLKMRMHDDPSWKPGYEDNSGYVEVTVTVLPSGNTP